MALKRRVEVLFDAEQYAKLERVAQAQGQSVGALVRKAVEREYLRPVAEERRRAVEELLQMEIPLGTWEEVKADLLKAMGSFVEAS